MVRQGEAVRVVRQFLTQLRKMPKCRIYMGNGVKGECYGKCLTASPPHQRDLVPMPGSCGNPVTDGQSLVSTHTGGQAHG
jgi:hypothetical protein